jgi:UDP-N-acetylmuramate: L-alanyl-gamma-D-glutamyl-meso-diaminopimelate ligase
MFGGLSMDVEESADNPENSTWSVLEGDEYKTSKENLRAKFFSYKPTHLLLTAVEWDHADVYKTETDYQNAFKELLQLIPQSGKIIACNDNKHLQTILHETEPRAPIITYGKNNYADYIYSDIKETTEGLAFLISHHNETYSISAPVIGSYMAENICGAFALACEIGIEPNLIIASIHHFHGLKRRLEKRGEINGATVFDDIAHSPTKAQSTLETLRRIYTGKIFAIFEPNSGNRRVEAIPFYDNAFKAASEILIPEYTKIKKDSGNTTSILEGNDVASILSKTHTDVKFLPNDSELVHYLKQKTQPADAVVFMGSHSFRGMIEELIS